MNLYCNNQATLHIVSSPRVPLKNPTQKLIVIFWDKLLPKEINPEVI